MNKLLKPNTVLIFCVLTLPWLIKLVIPFYPSWPYMTITMLSHSIIFLWFLFLDAEFIKRVPLKIRPSNILFLINLILIYLLSCAVIIYLGPGQQFNVTGLAALPFLYLFYAWFSIYNHLSKLLAFAEDEKEISFSKRMGDMILFFSFSLVLGGCSQESERFWKNLGLPRHPIWLPINRASFSIHAVVRENMYHRVRRSLKQRQR